MTLQELAALIEPGENETIEFKLKHPEPEKIMREATALANHRGGNLIFGVDDDGNIVGLKDPDEVIQAFISAEEKLCHPRLNYKMVEIEISKKRTVVLFHIPESKCKPHLVQDSDLRKHGTAYYRIGDKSVRASSALFQILRHQNRLEDTKFEYGDKEEKLMQLFEKEKIITVSSFARHAGIKSFIAGKTLILLTRANVLSIIPAEDEDKFILREGAFLSRPKVR